MGYCILSSSKWATNYEILEYALADDLLAYINTGIDVSSGGTIECKALFTQIRRGKFNVIYGAEQSANPWNEIIFRSTKGTESKWLTNAIYNYYVPYSPQPDLIANVTYTQSFTFSPNQGTATAIINNTTYNGGGSNKKVTSYPIYLFCENISNSPDHDRSMMGRIYYWRYYDSSNKLKSNLIPIKNKTTGKVGFIDLVNKNVLYSPTGNLKGSDTTIGWVTWDYRRSIISS